MSDGEITCITESAPSHEAIIGAGGVGWWWTVEQIIQSIDARTNTFFTVDAFGRADVRTVTGPPVSANAPLRQTLSQGLEVVE